MRKSTRKQISRRRFLQGAGGVLLAGAGLAWWEKGEAHRLTVERSTLALPRWSADGFRIAFLTDNHLSSDVAVDRAIRALNLAQTEKPHAIVIGGDTIDNHTRQTKGFIDRYFAAVKESGIPAFITLGNHDYWTFDTQTVIGYLCGDKTIRPLRNQTVEVDGVLLHGIDDGIAGRDKHNRLAARHDKNVVAIFHEPDFVDRIDVRASLMLAGHSHGGQIRLPYMSPMRLPRGAKQYIQGFFPSAPVPLYVSRGVGTSGPDIRTFCPPEVTILTLNSA
ncbi:MAG: metallophosphoesterase [Fimbriimonadaceae bacterium]|nr:metallophosphoesterase [Fimbriimonadaceae bacterium]